eukprot:scpid24804/ scgid10453/ Protein kinase byr2; MAPK kinase kinase; Protein kinase ste8
MIELDDGRRPVDSDRNMEHQDVRRMSGLPSKTSMTSSIGSSVSYMGRRRSRVASTDTVTSSGTDEVFEGVDLTSDTSPSPSNQRSNQHSNPPRADAPTERQASEQLHHGNHADDADRRHHSQPVAGGAASANAAAAASTAGGAGTGAAATATAPSASSASRSTSPDFDVYRPAVLDHIVLPSNRPHLRCHHRSLMSMLNIDDNGSIASTASSTASLRGSFASSSISLSMDFISEQEQCLLQESLERTFLCRTMCTSHAAWEHCSHHECAVWRAVIEHEQHCLLLKQGNGCRAIRHLLQVSHYHAVHCHGDRCPVTFCRHIKSQLGHRDDYARRASTMNSVRGSSGGISGGSERVAYGNGGSERLQEQIARWYGHDNTLDSNDDSSTSISPVDLGDLSAQVATATLYSMPSRGEQHEDTQGSSYLQLPIKKLSSSSTSTIVDVDVEADQSDSSLETPCNPVLTDPLRLSLNSDTSRTSTSTVMFGREQSLDTPMMMPSTSTTPTPLAGDGRRGSGDGSSCVSPQQRVNTGRRTMSPATDDDDELMEQAVFRSLRERAASVSPKPDSPHPMSPPPALPTQYPSLKSDSPIPLSQKTTPAPPRETGGSVGKSVKIVDPVGDARARDMDASANGNAGSSGASTSARLPSFARQGSFKTRAKERGATYRHSLPVNLQDMVSMEAEKSLSESLQSSGSVSSANHHQHQNSLRSSFRADSFSSIPEDAEHYVDMATSAYSHGSRSSIQFRPEVALLEGMRRKRGRGETSSGFSVSSSRTLKKRFNGRSTPSSLSGSAGSSRSPSLQASMDYGGGSGGGVGGSIGSSLSRSGSFSSYYSVGGGNPVSGGGSRSSVALSRQNSMSPSHIASSLRNFSFQSSSSLRSRTDSIASFQSTASMQSYASSYDSYANPEHSIIPPSVEVLHPYNEDKLPVSAEGTCNEETDWARVCVIGSGAFGRCLLCRPRTRSGQFAPKEKHFVVKVVQWNMPVNSEIDCWARLEHKNVLPLWGAARHDDSVLFFTELMPGGSVADFLFSADDKPYPLDEGKALSFLEQVLQGIKYMHTQRILHCDIKGSNILLADEERRFAKIADFGTAIDLRGDGTDGYETSVHSSAGGGGGLGFRSVVGSQPWMSPEVARSAAGADSYPRDIWACGCFLYEMLNAKAPWSCANVGSLIFMIGKCNSRDKVPKLPSNVSSFTQKLYDAMTTIDVADRATATELVEMFEDYRQKNGAGPRSLSSVGRDLLTEMSCQDDAAVENPGKSIADDGTLPSSRGDTLTPDLAMAVATDDDAGDADVTMVNMAADEKAMVLASAAARRGYANSSQNATTSSTSSGIDVSYDDHPVTINPDDADAADLPMEYTRASGNHDDSQSPATVTGHDADMDITVHEEEPHTAPSMWHYNHHADRSAVQPRPRSAAFAAAQGEDDVVMVTTQQYDPSNPSVQQQHQPSSSPSSSRLTAPSSSHGCGGSGAGDGGGSLGSSWE